MKILLSLFLTLLLSNCAGPGLDKYKDLVTADKPSAPSSGVKITYLGVNGYLLQSADSTVVVDPYFSKPGIIQWLTNDHLKPDKDRNEWAWRQFLPHHVDLMLVTHGHLDHLFDAPGLARKSGARLVASPTSCKLVALLPESERPALDRVTPILSGNSSEMAETRVFGNVKVQAFRVRHDRILGATPFPGTNVPDRPPAKASEWVAGEPLAFIITMGGRRIFICAGDISAPSPQAAAPVDLAIIGVALKDARNSFAAHLNVLKPHYVIPSHQDDLFTAPENGFHFGTTSDFTRVLNEYDKTGMPRQRLILLDYFRPWTLR